MSSQNSMFSPQENTPYEQVNTDPREQQYASQGQQQMWEQAGAQDTYEAGYGWTQPGGDWMGGEKIQASQSRRTYNGFPDSLRSLTWWQWLIVVLVLASIASSLWWFLNTIAGILFFLVAIAVVFIAVTQASLQKVVLPPEVFFVNGQTRLVINNPTGSIHIRRGSSDKVEVTATKYINGWLGSSYQGNVNSVQNGDSITVGASSNYKYSYLGGLRHVDFEISVPEFTDIQIEGNAGTIRVDGINGRYQLKSNAGTIQIAQGTVSEQSNISTSAGTINVVQSNLRGHVSFVTNAGTINYSGSLDPQGTYTFTTNLGTIDIGLPASSSFLLKAHTDLGSINNQFGGSIVGESPHATVELKTNLGSINVHKIW